MSGLDNVKDKVLGEMKEMEGKAKKSFADAKDILEKKTGEVTEEVKEKAEGITNSIKDQLK